MKRLMRMTAVLLTFGVAACATTAPAPSSDGGLNWAAHGYLTPGMTDEPEFIGAFESEAECLDAVDAWMSRQVVGNPVSGECLPVDRR